MCWMNKIAVPAKKRRACDERFGISTFERVAHSTPSIAMLFDENRSPFRLGKTMILDESNNFSVGRAHACGASSSPPRNVGPAHIHRAQAFRNVESRDFVSREIDNDQLDLIDRSLRSDRVDDTLRTLSTRARDEYG